MNCQDFSRLLDGQELHEFPTATRDAAEAHLATCSNCKRHHQLHRHLATLSVPSPSAETIAGWRALAAIEGVAYGDRRRRGRFILIGAVAALAAAAGMLAIWLGSTTAPPTRPSVAQIPPANLASASAIAETNAFAADAVEPKPANPAAQTTAQHTNGLPLLLPPDAGKQPQPDTDKALQNAVERHPELVEGPPTEGKFVVAMTVRGNGSVVSSSARFVVSGKMLDAYAELEPTRPTDGAFVQSDASFGQDEVLPDGRSLRAQVMLRITMVPDGYDMTRSSTLVDQLVRTRYHDLMLPADGGELNSLTILLTEDGQIERQKVERVRFEGGQIVRDRAELVRLEELRVRLQGAAISGDALGLASLQAAERIAGPLGIAIDQIGLVGSLNVEESSMARVENEQGIRRLVEQRLSLLVTYAWQRRQGESAPRMGQGATLAFARREFDMAAARTIVERLIPDAFTSKNSTAGMPVIVLNAKGEVTSTLRLKARGIEFVDHPSAMQEIQERVPGFRPGIMKTDAFTNKYGDTATVTFVWEGAGSTQ